MQSRSIAATSALGIVRMAAVLDSLHWLDWGTSKSVKLSFYLYQVMRLTTGSENSFGA